MNRRQFCKYAALAAASIGLGRLESKGANLAKGFCANPVTAQMPGDCNIAVLRRECHSDLQSIFLDDPDCGPCKHFRSGDKFTFKRGEGCPESFCPSLWSSVCTMVEAEVCAPGLKSRTRLVSCPDGTRPVIVRIDIS